LILSNLYALKKRVNFLLHFLLKNAESFVSRGFHHVKQMLNVLNTVVTFSKSIYKDLMTSL